MHPPRHVPEIAQAMSMQTTNAKVHSCHDKFKADTVALGSKPEHSLELNTRRSKWCWHQDSGRRGELFPYDYTTIAVGNNIIKVAKDSITLTADQATLRLTSSTFVLSGVSSATINGKPIMVIGGKDSRGDTMSVSGI